MPNKLIAILALAGAVLAGPIEFGRAELDQAIAVRHLNSRLFQIKTQVSVDPPESYRVVPGLITGGDLRGLMYGLLAAADQVRRTGRLQKEEGVAGLAVRGVRARIDEFSGDLEWFHGREQWPALFRGLAASRFNRFQFAVPDLSGLVSLPEFPQVPTVEAAEKNLEALHFISDTAAEYGVDVTLGVWTRQVADGPFLYAALGKVLSACPAIRGVQLRMSSELAKDAIRAIRDTGRRITIEIPPEAQEAATLAAAEGLPVRYSAPYPGTARPVKGTQLMWELGDPPDGGVPDLTRLVTKLAGTGAAGFEVDLPQSMLGRAQDPPTWMLLGRLGYDVREAK